MDDSVSRRGFLAGLAAAGTSAGAAGTAGAQETTTGGDGGGGGTTQQVDLVDYAYEPGTDDALQIRPGTTVEFVWQTDTHNINIDSKPEGSDWEGVMSIENSGYTHTHTFETLGTYEFHCDPHINLGMVGSIEVTETPGAGGGGFESILPDSAKTLGVVTVGALASLLGLTYFFMKYGGWEPAEE
jgi:plastocyanin